MNLFQKEAASKTSSPKGILHGSSQHCCLTQHICTHRRQGGCSVAYTSGRHSSSPQQDPTSLPLCHFTASPKLWKKKIRISSKLIHGWNSWLHFPWLKRPDIHRLHEKTKAVIQVIPPESLLCSNHTHFNPSGGRKSKPSRQTPEEIPGTKCTGVLTPPSHPEIPVPRRLTEHSSWAWAVSAHFRLSSTSFVNSTSVAKLVHKCILELCVLAQ